MDRQKHDALNITPGLCIAMLTPDGGWAWDAARCPQPAEQYVCSDSTDVGLTDDKGWHPATAYEPLCGSHAAAVKATSRFHWSQPLSSPAGKDAG